VAALASDGTLVLTPEELAHLRETVSRWELAPPGPVADSVATALAYDLRDVLAGLPIGYGRG
jgi:hypothetical protein